MTESLFARVKRVLSAGVEGAADALERGGGASVMCETIREVDRAIEDARAEHATASTQRLQAIRQQRLFRDQISALAEKARFAMLRKRDDLAEAAVSRQLDYEAQAARLDVVQAEAQAEVARLEACMAALAARGAHMRGTLAAFESAQREAARVGDAPAAVSRGTARRVDMAEAAFNRAMQGAGGLAGLDCGNAVAAAAVAEITVLQQAAAVAERMAALRQNAAAGG